MKTSERLSLIVVTGVFAFVLAGCSDPKSTKLPEDLAQMSTIAPQVQKLNDEEKNLLTAYVLRRTMKGTLFGAIAGDTGETKGMTIGQALDNQRAYITAKKKEEDEAKALKEKLKAEQEAVMKQIREAVSVALISKKVESERGYSGIEMDRKLVVSIGYKNNGSKDIAAVKGEVRIVDLLGDEVTGLVISNNDTIKVGGTSVWKGSKSLRFSMNSSADEKFANLPDDKFKVIWLPKAIAFTDGTKLSVPD